MIAIYVLPVWSLNHQAEIIGSTIFHYHNFWTNAAISKSFFDLEFTKGGGGYPSKFQLFSSKCIGMEQEEQDSSVAFS